MATSSGIQHHPVVSHEEWLSARKAFLVKEKQFSRIRDDLNRERRALPWERVEKPYAFDGPNGRETLADLFQGKSQLIVYHFMFHPDAQEGCKHCSFWADHFDAVGIHLKHRDTTLVVASRAPLARITPFQSRMGWKFKWVSSEGSDFNYDYHVSFDPDEAKAGNAVYNYTKTNPGPTDREGVSVFFKDEGDAVYHTYSAYARGIDMLNTTYHLLDLTPKGRDEGESPQSWVEYHDRYTD